MMLSTRCHDVMDPGGMIRLISLISRRLRDYYYYYYSSSFPPRFFALINTTREYYLPCLQHPLTVKRITSIHLRQGQFLSLHEFWGFRQQQRLWSTSITCEYSCSNTGI